MHRGSSRMRGWPPQAWRTFREASPAIPPSRRGLAGAPSSPSSGDGSDRLFSEKKPGDCGGHAADHSFARGMRPRQPEISEEESTRLERPTPFSEFIANGTSGEAGRG